MWYFLALLWLVKCVHILFIVASFTWVEEESVCRGVGGGGYGVRGVWGAGGSDCAELPTLDSPPLLPTAPPLSPVAGRLLSASLVFFSCPRLSRTAPTPRLWTYSVRA